MRDYPMEKDEKKSTTDLEAKNTKEGNWSLIKMQGKLQLNVSSRKI